jgi:pimeloyl-ACP methyl ester carboxylesterase/DNA-binding CsgD family transcriptional regulator
MDAPPVQFVKTDDGLSIAYTDCGEGLPLIRMPFPFNNLRRMWQQQTNLSLFEPLANHFRLIRYDSRGQGMSTRELGSDHSYADYMFDLEAVIDGLGLHRFVLLGGLLSGHTAIEYAAKHPDRVVALILLGVPPHNPIGRMESLEDLAMRDWETFLFTTAGINRRQGDPRGDAASVDYFRETITQDGLLAMIRASRRSQVQLHFPLLRAPTLVVSELATSYSEENAKALAASITGSHLVLLEGPLMSSMYTTDGSVPRLVSVIEDFMRSLPSSPAVDARQVPEVAGTLSQREMEVLRLLALGLSNQQIADDLVISLNTVRRHVSNVFDKTGAANRVEAATYAKDHGIA